MAGRKPSSETGKLSQKVKDALLSLWINQEDPLTFMQIHKGLVRKLIVKEKHKAATNRILKKAQEQGLVKHESGSREYLITIVPEEFRVFDYLQRLRQKTVTTRFQVGGSFWSLCQLYLVGMPQSSLENPDLQNMLQVLGVRISRLYEAFRALAQEAKRRQTLPNTSHHIPYDAARELLLELIPYYLGSKAGCDGDGLAIEDFNMLIPEMVDALPEEAEPQNPTLKDIILRHFKVFNELIRNEEKHWELEWRSYLSPEEKAQDFGLVIVPPEALVAENDYDKRWIKQVLEEYASKSPLYIASSLLSSKKENVDNIFDIYGRRMLEEKKLNETRELYKKMYASSEVDRLIDGFSFYPKEDKRKAMQMITDLTEKHGRKSIIVYLVFSQSSKCWFIPTPEKEKLLQRFFPRHSKQEIHDWLAEGAELHKPLSEEKFQDLKKEAETLKKRKAK